MAERSRGLLDERQCTVGGTDVRDDRHGLTRQRLGGSLDPITVAATDGHADAFGRERPGRGKAEPSRRAGDRGTPSLDAQVHVSAFSRRGPGWSLRARPDEPCRSGSSR